MSIGGYKIRDKEAIHFLTFAVVEWVDVFTRKAYRDIVVDSLRHCQQQKGLVLHGWCIMSNHVHLLASAREANLSDILRDFKRFTAKQLVAAIGANEHESRRGWMLAIFRQQGTVNSRNESCQFWRQDNQPKECYSRLHCTKVRLHSSQSCRSRPRGKARALSVQQRTSVCHGQQPTLAAG